MSISKIKICSFIFLIVVVLGGLISALGPGIPSEVSGGGAINPILSNVLCQPGPVGNLEIDNLDFEVIGFGENNEWYIFDEINAEITFKNHENKSIEDLIISWGIYNNQTNKLIVESEENMVIIKENNKESVTFIFTLYPNYFNKNDIENSFRFYIRARGNTEDSKVVCTQAYKNISIIRDRDFVILKNLSLPISAKIGNVVNGNFIVWNIGGDDQNDISIKIFNETLGLNKTIEIGDLHTLENKPFNFSFDILNNIHDGRYIIRFEVINEDNDIYENENNDDSIFFKSILIEKAQDISYPTIELLGPKDHYIKKTNRSSYEIDFIFNVYDNSEILRCYLILDENIEKTNININKYVENIFSVELDRGSYDWKIECVDSSDNKGISEIRELKIKKKSSNNISYDNSLNILNFENNNVKSNKTNNITEELKEPETLNLNQEASKNNKGFIESIFDWLKSLFS